MNRQQEIILMLTSIGIVVCVWIGFNLYHNAFSSTISKSLNADIVPITPNFNTAVIKSLKQREYVNPKYSFPSQQSPTPTPILIKSGPTVSLTVQPTIIVIPISQTIPSIKQQQVPIP